jgi:hypothetical protein
LQDNVNQQSQSMMKRFHKKEIFCFFLTGSEAPCLIGQMEGWNGMNQAFCEREPGSASQLFFNDA